MMTEKQQADFDRCAYFIAEMIAKYGTDVLDEIAKEKRDPHNTGTITAA